MAKKRNFNDRHMQLPQAALRVEGVTTSTSTSYELKGIRYN